MWFSIQFVYDLVIRLYDFMMVNLCRYPSSITSSESLDRSDPPHPPNEHGSIQPITDESVHQSTANSSDPLDNVCPICLGTIQYDIINTVCHHVYHRSCLEQWLVHSTVCPLCRTDLTPAIIPPRLLLSPMKRIQNLRNVNQYIETHHPMYLAWNECPHSAEGQSHSQSIGMTHNYQYNPYDLQTSLGYSDYSIGGPLLPPEPHHF